MTTTINTATPDYIVDGTLTDGEAWVPLQTTILSGTAEAVEFASTTGANDWSQYMSLAIMAYSKTNSGANNDYLRVMINASGTVTGGYNDQGYWSNTAGGTAQGGKDTSTTQGFGGYQAGGGGSITGIFSSNLIIIPDINSGKFPNTLTTFANTVATTDSRVGIWSSTRSSQAPVTSVWVSNYPGGSDDFVAGSRFDMWGILPRMVTA